MILDNKPEAKKESSWKGMHKGRITNPTLKESRSNRKPHSVRRLERVEHERGLQK